MKALPFLEKTIIVGLGFRGNQGIYNDYDLPQRNRTSLRCKDTFVSRQRYRIFFNSPFTFL